MTPRMPPNVFRRTGGQCLFALHQPERRACLKERLAALEGGRFAVATASGMAAVSGLLLALLKAGDHVVASRELFGSTMSVFTKVFARFGIDTTFVKPHRRR